MSWSLQISHGDFVTVGASLGIVTRQSKMLQDLRNWILERMGTDDIHPDYGSLLDGGVEPDGTEVGGVIGGDDFSIAAMLVEQDIRRIISQYQAVQLTRAKADKSIYGRGTLTPEEVVLNVPSITFAQSLDKLKVVINIITATNDPLALQIPLDTRPSTS